MCSFPLCRAKSLLPLGFRTLPSESTLFSAKYFTFGSGLCFAKNNHSSVLFESRRKKNRIGGGGVANKGDEQIIEQMGNFLNKYSFNASIKKGNKGVTMKLSCKDTAEAT